MISFSQLESAEVGLSSPYTNAVVALLGCILFVCLIFVIFICCGKKKESTPVKSTEQSPGQSQSIGQNINKSKKALAVGASIKSKFVIDYLMVKILDSFNPLAASGDRSDQRAKSVAVNKEVAPVVDSPPTVDQPKVVENKTSKSFIGKQQEITPGKVAERSTKLSIRKQLEVTPGESKFASAIGLSIAKTKSTRTPSKSIIKGMSSGGSLKVMTSGTTKATFTTPGTPTKGTLSEGPSQNPIVNKQTSIARQSFQTAILPQEQPDVDAKGKGPIDAKKVSVSATKKKIPDFKPEHTFYGVPMTMEM